MGCTSISVENKNPITSVCTVIDRHTIGLLNISFTAFHSRPICKGRRLGLGRVSGRRSMAQTTQVAEKTMNDKNTPRQSDRAMITAPIAGAKAGTTTKIIITKDMILAICRPE